MKKKLLWALISLLIAGLTIWAVASQSRSFSLTDLKNLILSAHKGWLICAFFAMFMGLVMRVLKNVFEKAVELKSESDFTI